jgi:hypothetical protein
LDADQWYIVVVAIVVKKGKVRKELWTGDSRHGSGSCTPGSTGRHPKYEVIPCAINRNVKTFGPGASVKAKKQHRGGCRVKDVEEQSQQWITGGQGDIGQMPWLSYSSCSSNGLQLFGHETVFLYKKSVHLREVFGYPC